MAWYTTGTINLTNGSTTVTGVGTDWVGRVMNGETLVAPDNLVYEVLSIQSDTSLILGRPYQGPTASAQPYQIMPTQQYIRELAANVQTLINQYGAERLEGLSINAPVTGEVLTYGATGLWENTPVQLGLMELTDVAAPIPPVAGDFLKYSGTEWRPGDAPTAVLASMSDANIVSPERGQVLWYDGAQWTNAWSHYTPGGGSGYLGDPFYSMVACHMPLTTYSDVTDGDPVWNQTVLAMHFNGADLGTSFPCQKGNVITVHGGVRTQITPRKFGTAAAYFPPGTNAALSLPGSSDFAFGSGDFVMDMWVRINLIALPGGGAAGHMYLLSMDGTTPLRLYIDSTTGFPTLTDGVTNVVCPIPIMVKQWAHIAVERSNGFVTIYVNGIAGCTVDYPVVVVAPSSVVIGALDTLGTNQLIGSLDDTRIAKGVERYGVNFAPATSAFPENAATPVDLRGNQVFSVGAPQINRFGIRFNKPTAYFDGASYIYTVWSAASATQAPFTVKSTFEFSAKGTNWASGTHTVFDYEGALTIQVVAGYPKLIVWLDNVTPIVITSVSQVQNDQWVHFCASYNGSLMYFFVDGALVGSQALTTAIGADPYAANVHSHFPFNGIEGGFVFTDMSASPKTMTTPSTIEAYTTTSDAHSGGSCLYIPETGFVRYGSGQSPGFGTSDFTLEFWVKPEQLASESQFTSWERNSSGTMVGGKILIRNGAVGTTVGAVECAFGYNLLASRHTIYSRGTQEMVPYNHPCRLPNNGPYKWTHMAVTRTAGWLRLFIDGVLERVINVGSASFDSASAGNPMAIGSNSVLDYPYSGFVGRVNDFRFTNACRYTANFTPPNALAYGGINRQLALGGSASGGSFAGYISDFRATDGYARYVAPFGIPEDFYPNYIDDTQPDAFKSYNTLMLHAEGTHGAADVSWVDSSATPKNLTPTLYVSKSTETPYLDSINEVYDPAIHGGSIYIAGDGNASKLTINSGPSGVMTFAGWIKPENATGVLFGLGHAGSSASAGGVFYVQLDSSTRVIKLYRSTTGGITPSLINSGGLPLTLGTWNHIALIRNASNQWYLYVNGVYDTTFGTYTDATVFTSAYGIVLGAHVGEPSSTFSGHFADFTLKYEATWPANSSFSPPTSLVATQGVSGYGFALGVGDIKVKDSRNSMPIATSGAVRLSSAEKKFGSTSLYFPGGTNDFFYSTCGFVSPLYSPVRKWEVSATKDYTAEAWVFFNALTGSATIMGINPWLSASSIGRQYLLSANTTNGFTLALATVASGYSQFIYSGLVPEVGRWYHVAISKTGGLWRLFVDGQLRGSKSVAVVVSSTNQVFTLGALPYGGSALSGFLDEVRITQGFCRYVTNFPVPTAPFE